MKPNCRMVALDLKDAYYSVPVAKVHWKFLHFEFEGKLYEFSCLLNGLSSAPRVFAKLVKPALSMLQEKGIYDGRLFIVYST